MNILILVIIMAQAPSLSPGVIQQLQQGTHPPSLTGQPWNWMERKPELPKSAPLILAPQNQFLLPVNKDIQCGDAGCKIKEGEE